MFLRFVVAVNDPNSGRRQGLFHAISDLQYAGRLTLEEEDLYSDLRHWFNEHL